MIPDPGRASNVFGALRSVPPPVSVADEEAAADTPAAVDPLDEHQDPAAGPGGADPVYEAAVHFIADAVIADPAGAAAFSRFLRRLCDAIDSVSPETAIHAADARIADALKHRKK
ncbi:hypothetical protein [Mycolicibacterium sp. F2034L]|uniref:hypothetical protein n=1 Tax=Mycolicibacterium sp. F2034L TaxID=2926422 RepID=UPI001FF682C0|nr:hypothetical protein [Mycolicibacterium sp. F2034L]MCK0174772.1 hypothetical protein [Mycolicibacterium sp. F2034L]